VKEKYVYHLYSIRSTYGAVPNFIRSSDLRSAGFSSLYAVTAETAEAIKQEGTSKGFKGVVWSERLWLDFDTPEASGRARSRLKEMEYDHVVYETGNRGVHIGILRDAAPSHLLPLRDKAWVKEHFPEADAGIYTHLHPFRIPGTIHEKTGKRKQLAYHQEGSALTLPKLEDEVFQNGSGGEAAWKEGRAASIFDSRRIMAATAPPDPNLDRHPALVRLLYSLYNEGVEYDKAFWWMCEWNKMLEVPKEDYELEKAFRSIYK
jgi:hypothetical protein